MAQAFPLLDTAPDASANDDVIRLRSSRITRRSVVGDLAWGTVPSLLMMVAVVVGAPDWLVALLFAVSLPTALLVPWRWEAIRDDWNAMLASTQGEPRNKSHTSIRRNENQRYFGPKAQVDDGVKVSVYRDRLVIRRRDDVWELPRTVEGGLEIRKGQIVVGETSAPGKGIDGAALIDAAEQMGWFTPLETREPAGNYTELAPAASTSAWEQPPLPEGVQLKAGSTILDSGRFFRFEPLEPFTWLCGAPLVAMLVATWGTLIVSAPVARLLAHMVPILGAVFLLSLVYVGLVAWPWQTHEGKLGWYRIEITPKEITVEAGERDRIRLVPDQPIRVARATKLIKQKRTSRCVPLLDVDRFVAEAVAYGYRVIVDGELRQLAGRG